MAFFLRRPFAVSAAAKQFSQPSQIVFRGIHNSPLKQSTNFSKPSSPISIFAKSRNAFQQTFRRSYMEQTSRSPLQSGDLRQRLIYGAAIFGGTLVGINLLFNRETRTDGGMPEYERSFLNETFLHTGLGIGTIGIAARALHSSGWSIRLMSANPWLVMGLGLAGSFATMIGTRATDPDK
jgi:growth hormone-inducible transmembrane protein